MNTNSMSLNTLASRWWAVGLRGLAAVVFGIVALARPGAGLLALVFVWAAYAIADGVFNLIAAAHSGRGSWGWFLFEGVIGVIAGIVALAWPAMTALVLVILIAIWAVVTGVAEIAAAIALRRVLDREWLLVVSGVLSIVLGVLLFAYPGAGALTLVVLIGAYALAFGVLLLALAFKLERHAHPRMPMGHAPQI
jgi:uncharacterized membrane protein HdeD (DUF308 family)